MYYNIKIYKEYSDGTNNKVLNLSTPETDGSDAVLRDLLNTAANSRSVETWSYTLSSVSMCKELAKPNYIAVELSISNISYSSVKAIKESLRSQFVDAEVSLSLIYSKVYDKDRDMLLASKHRVVNIHLSNICRTGTGTNVNVKLDIYSPDYYATLNTHSEVFTGKQFGDIMTKCTSRFTYLKDMFDEESAIKKSYNLYYRYNYDVPTVTKTKVDNSEVKSGSNTITTYNETEETKIIIVPHIIPYSVQYNESSYDFMLRLCRRFGETLYFEDGRLRVGIHPKMADSVSLSSVVSTISFSEQTDSQTSMYVGGNYITNTSNSFKQYGSSADKDTYNIVNQEVGGDEANVDLLSSIDLKWAEDNPKYDDYYLDYIGKTDSETGAISQDDRYNIVTNAIVYWPAIIVRLLFQVLTFKLTEPDKYSDFILENALSIWESYRLVGEINEGHNEHVESDSDYIPKRHFEITKTVTYQQNYTKPTTDTNSSNFGDPVSNTKTDPTTTYSNEIANVQPAKVAKSKNKRVIDGVRYVDSPRGLAEIMCKSDLALTSFIVKTSAESGRNIIKVTLQSSNDFLTAKSAIVTALRLGSIVTLDDDAGADRYVVSRINVYTGQDEYSTPIVEIDLLPAVATSYSNIIGDSNTALKYDIEVAIPYFTADDMIRRAEPQRAIVVDIRDSRKLNRARVCYPWQYATEEAVKKAAEIAAEKAEEEKKKKKKKKDSTTTTNDPVSAMSDGRALTAVSRFEKLADNLALNASPWLRVSSPGHKGGGTGFVSAPGVDTEVMVCYESGNIERPYISGSLFTGPGAAFMGQQISDVTAIGSRYGRKIMLCDTAVAGGSSVLTSIFPFTSLLGIETSGAVDEALDGYIQIGDQYGLCSLNMSSTTRAISISTPMGKVNISALTGINIIAPSGDVTISGKNVNIMAENNLNIMSGTRVGRMRKAKADYSGKSVKGKIATALGKAAMGAVEWGIGELIDLSLVRTIFECFVAPVGGTMVIKSHRYMCIEGGAGRTNMPESANIKCYIGDVLAGFIKVFDPVDDWRIVAYNKCRNGVLKELVGSAATDRGSLIYKYFGEAAGTLNDSGSNLRTYLTDRMVDISAFPPIDGNAAKTFTDDAVGYGQYLGGIVRTSVDNTMAQDIQVIQHIYDDINRHELRSKLKSVMTAYNDLKKFYDESVTYAGDRDNNKEKAGFIGARLDAIPEKFVGVSENGIKNLITAKLFNGVRPTLSEVKNGGATYRLLNQAMYAEAATDKLAAKRILLLILMRMVTGDILKRYDLDVPANFGGITADMLFGANKFPIDAANMNIRRVLNKYVNNATAPVTVGVNMSAMNVLVADDVTAVNRDWSAMCSDFTLGLEINSKSYVVNKLAGLGAMIDSASGLELSTMARDSIIPLNRVRSDRRTSDVGTILLSGSPGTTIKFNPQTAVFEKVQTTENPVDAAFKLAMLSL